MLFFTAGLFHEIEKEYFFPFLEGCQIQVGSNDLDEFWCLSVRKCSGKMNESEDGFAHVLSLSEARLQPLLSSSAFEVKNWK